MVNKLEIEESSDLAGDFEAFSTVSFSSFLAGYNCLQQLKGRPVSYLVNKLETEVSSDLAGDFEAFSSVSFTLFLTS